MIVAIDFLNLKSMCKHHAKLRCADDMDVEDICIKYKDSWGTCDEFSCPYCNLKDEDDGK